jgi:trimeric autotransporter adhesin
LGKKTFKAMKKIFFFATILSSIVLSKTFAQSITLSPTSQNMIEANSTSQGVLFPRMNTSQRTAIITPANGLLVYDTDTNGFWYSQNGIWTELPKSSLWTLNGLAGNEIRNTNAGGFWSSNPTILPFLDDSGLPLTAPVSGAGTRMMWISSRSAFRCGTVNGDAWDAANIGLHSFAMGYNSRASGVGNVSIGINSVSDGTSNTVAIGENTQATGTNGVAFGTGCNSNSYYSIAMGYYNLIPIANATSWVATDPLFTIGNGQNSAARSNAFMMLKNGKTAIGNTTPESFFHVFQGESGATSNPNSITTFEKNGTGYIAILTPEANENGISFGLSSSNVSGGIYYNSSAAKGLQFRTNGNSTKMSILANGNVGIGVSPSAKLEVNGNVIVGTNGTAINEIIKVTVNADISSIAAISTISKTFTITNAALGSTVYVSPDGNLPDGIIIANARVSAANTVTVKFTNATTVALNPASMDYHITVIR